MKIALVDDHSLLTETLKNLLQQTDSSNDVTTYNSADTFLSDTGNNSFDIIITDLMMPGTNGVQLIEKSKAKNKRDLKFIVLSSINDVPTIKNAIRIGASAYLSKATPVAELLEAISEVMDGKTYIGKDLRNNLVNSVFAEEQIVYHLSPREKDVLNYICKGFTIKEIAFELKLSLHTIQFYHRNVMAKFNVNRTADLIIFAMHNGLYVPDADQKTIISK